MAVIKSDQDTPPTPPPEYTNVPSIATVPSQQSATTVSETAAYPFPTPQPYIPHHPQAAYGPTPILQQPGTLPYYDPRSPFATEQAISRARWRFFWAMVWAFGIWIAIGLVTGGVAIEHTHIPDDPVIVAAEQLIAQATDY